MSAASGAGAVRSMARLALALALSTTSPISSPITGAAAVAQVRSVEGQHGQAHLEHHLGVRRNSKLRHSRGQRHSKGAAEASLAEVSSQHGRSSASHQQHQRRKSKHHHGHHANRTVQQGNLTLDDALEHVPARVHELFVQVQAGTGNSANFLASLNEVYKRALTVHDKLTFDCKDKQEAAKTESGAARDALEETEQSLTQLQDRMQSLTQGIDGSLAELEALRERFEARRDQCSKNKEKESKALQMLGEDAPKAKALYDGVTASCGYGGGTPLVLIECSLPDGSYVVTFKDQARRDEVAALSGLSERLLALQLERALRAQVVSGGAAALLQTKANATHRLRGASAQVAAGQHRHRRVAGSRKLFLLQRHKASASVRDAPPDDLCADASPVPCPSFADYMDSFVGGVADLADELKVRMNDEDQLCRNALDSFATRIKKLKHSSDDANVAYANAVADHNDMSTARHMQRDEVRQLTGEATHTAEQCEQQLDDSAATMCSAKMLAKEASLSAGFVGFCEVTDWVAEPCSKPCGEGGEQNLTRRVVYAPGETPECPALQMTRKCNEKPCPIDGLMSRWEEWSECSQACGGGTRTRHRQVVRQAQHGGLPTGETMQEEVCNTHACDQACVLSEWTAWSNCSKACDGGHRARKRNVLRQPLGDSSCPQEFDDQRFQTAACNRTECRASPVVQCKDKLDVVFALDSSGSVTDAGFTDMKSFVSGLVGRTTFSGDDGIVLAQVGAVQFGAKATMLNELTSDSAALLGKVSGATYAPEATNTGEALAVAGQMLEQHGRAGVQQVIVVLTDGMPLSSYILKSEAERLKSNGIRIVFVLVGAGVSRRTAEQWVSCPAKENVIKVPSFAKLKEEAAVTSVLATLCAKLD